MKPTLSALALSAGVFVFAVSNASAAVISTFDTDADGWTAFQNAGAPTHSPTGGNPGGHIHILDFTSDWAYLRAPSKFLVPAPYNGTLSFDLKIENGNPTAFPNIYNVRVGIQGAGLTLIAESSLPTTDWQSYVFELNETSNWRVFSNLSQNYNPAAPAPTQSQLLAVLDDLTLIVIATDYSNATFNDNGGIDRTFLDNVRLGFADIPGETPIPGALPLFATGLGALGFVMHRRRKKLAA